MFYGTLNNQISHTHPKIAYLVGKLKIYCSKAYKKYTNSLVSNMLSNNDDYNNASMDIFKFIKCFDTNCDCSFDIIKLYGNLKDEENNVYDISKRFFDLIFADDDVFINYLINDENKENEKNK